MSRIALFSGKDCLQLALLHGILVEKNVAPLVFDMRLGGDGMPLISFGSKQATWGNQDFSDVSAMYIRCRTPNTMPSLPPVLNSAFYSDYRGDFIKEQGFSAATYSFFADQLKAGKLVINELSTYSDHDTKAQFYEKLRAHQFPVPETLTTNDPQRALAFVDYHKEVVVKPSVGVGSTRLFTIQDRERLNQIRLCPLMMQKRIAGDTLRVNIVGDSVVLALRVLGSGKTVDSRTAPQGFDFVKLPDAEEERIVKANRMLGLHYAAWDIIEAKDGGYIYLDCNPGPYILWTGDVFSRIVMEQLAEYMIAYTRTGSIATASKAVRPYSPQSH